MKGRAHLSPFTAFKGCISRRFFSKCSCNCFDRQKVLTACKRLPESFENRGKTKQIEYGAYEVRCFSEMLLKGSVVILEVNNIIVDCS